MKLLFYVGGVLFFLSDSLCRLGCSLQEVYYDYKDSWTFQPLVWWTYYSFHSQRNYFKGFKVIYCWGDEDHDDWE